MTTTHNTNNTTTRTNGNLCDYATGDTLRGATAAEAQASSDAALIDGGAGVIAVDGRPCYVEEVADRAKPLHL